MIPSRPDRSGVLIQLTIVGILAAVEAWFAAHGHHVQWPLIALLAAIAGVSLAHAPGTRP